MRIPTLICAVILTIASFATSSANAEAVKIEGVHLCCGACIKGANKALEGVEGVSGVNVEKDDRQVTFEAANAKAARRGVRALAKAGFYGSANFNGKTIALKNPVEAGTKADSATVSGVHLCCPGCFKAAEAALKEVDGVSEVTSNKDKKTIAVSGEGIPLSGLVDALREIGFNARVK